MSKQLALSIAFSVMTMSAFVLSMSAPHDGSTLHASYKNGAVAEAAAPSLFSVFAN